VIVSWPHASAAAIGAQWSYGAAGLIGFLAQVIMGIQADCCRCRRGVQLSSHRQESPPSRSAHELASSSLAKWMFICWTVGVPVLAVGVVRVHALMTAGASAILLAGVVLSAAQGVHIVSTARRSRTAHARNG
jgi:hypothetical protein